MKISIITVCKNAERRIQKALDSVIQQTYQDIEYIVIDGNSTDKTRQIIDQDSNFISKFISESDNGVYEAIDKGIHMASGEYIFS